MARLADNMLQVAQLVGVLQPPVPVAGAHLPPPPPGCIGAAEVFDVLAARLGLPLVVVNEMPYSADVFASVVSDHLGLDRRADALTLPADALFGIGAVATQAFADRFDRLRAWSDVVSFDGIPLQAYAMGDPAAPTVVIASACGMPASLCQGWMNELSEDFFVVTWESRGLFGSVPVFDGLATDAHAQASDAVAVMDHFGVLDAHVMGFCGGSVVALIAAVAHPTRVRSLSLWHGAYELGPDSPKTQHHRDIQALMGLAAESRASARAVRAVFSQAMLNGAPPSLGHLVLYPFATEELLYRYCRVNGAITDIDVRDLLGSVVQPVLIVTSEDDVTAHPEASKYVASRLRAASLRIEPHGDHLSLFTDAVRLAPVAKDFLRHTAAATAR